MSNVQVHYYKTTQGFAEMEILAKNAEMQRETASDLRGLSQRICLFCRWIFSCGFSQKTPAQSSGDS